jgi:hypothetical protein
LAGRGHPDVAGCELVLRGGQFGAAGGHAGRVSRFGGERGGEQTLAEGDLGAGSSPCVDEGGGQPGIRSRHQVGQPAGAAEFEQPQGR